MRAVVLMLLLVLAAFGIGQGAKVGTETVGELLEGLKGTTEANTMLVRSVYANGLMTGVHVAGMTCQQRYTAGELLSYLDYTARRNEFVMIAAMNFFYDRGCRLDPGTPYYGLFHSK